MNPCPCGSNLDYLVCCNPCLANEAIAKTPEALMRSRYTAYTLRNTEYIKKTMLGKPLSGFNEQEALSWSQSIHWLGLKIIKSWDEDELSGFVEFAASFIDNNSIKIMHEISEFQKIDQRWYYTDGKHIPEAKIDISRNASCPCGSNKKFKNCHAK